MATSRGSRSFRAIARDHLDSSAVAHDTVATAAATLRLLDAGE
jgi:hypothetical protein